MGMEVGVNGSHGHVILTCMSEKWIHEVGELIRDRLWGDEYSIWVELNVMNMCRPPFGARFSAAQFCQVSLSRVATCRLLVGCCGISLVELMDK